jgi:hypothetical protein
MHAQAMCIQDPALTASHSSTCTPRQQQLASASSLRWLTATASAHVCTHNLVPCLSKLVVAARRLMPLWHAAVALMEHPSSIAVCTRPPTIALSHWLRTQTKTKPYQNKEERPHPRCDLTPAACMPAGPSIPA